MNRSIHLSELLFGAVIVAGSILMPPRTLRISDAEIQYMRAVNESTVTALLNSDVPTRTTRQIMDGIDSTMRIIGRARVDTMGRR